jgi:predicted O-methyltransferase YrrM
MQTGHVAIVFTRYHFILMNMFIIPSHFIVNAVDVIKTASSCSHSEDVLKSLERMAQKEFMPFVGPIKGKIIGHIIREHKPMNVLEIGTLYGYSAILMADLLPSHGKVTTIETNKSNAAIARKNILKAELSEKIEVIPGNALTIIPKLTKSKFDLIFLDAAKHEYLKYLKLAEQNSLLRKGSVIIADNVRVSKDELSDYLEYVRNSGNYKSKAIETKLEFTVGIKDAIEVSVKIN